jgi:hypothetical protein
MVRNAQTGAVGVEAVSFGVPQFDKLTVLPPFFAEPQGRWLLLREPVADPTGGLVYPFVVAGEPFIPAVTLEVPAGAKVDLMLQAYGVETSEPLVSFAIRGAGGLLPENGVVRALRRLPAEPGSASKFVAALDSTGLAPGRYWLDVQLTDRAKGTSASSSAPFSVIR